MKTEVKLDFDALRADFPILAMKVRGNSIAYLDNAATSQKPLSVIQAVERYYLSENANVHRGVHYLSQLATEEYESAREKVRVLLNARTTREVIFTRGCTESLNLVAWCLTSGAPNLATQGKSGRVAIGEGDEILVSQMEHHSNIVPWQMAAERVGARLRVIPITDAGEIDLDAYSALLNERTRVVAITHVSNAMGTINPIKRIVAMAHDAGALTVVDGAQAGPHVSIDVQDIDADFYTLSCHKIYAPTGIGVLYGKEDLLAALPPYQGGGDMIRTVSFEQSTFAELPARLEAGTPPIAEAIGLGAAIDYLIAIGREAEGASDPRANLVAAMNLIHDRDAALANYATEAMSDIPGIRFTGTSPNKAGIVGFTLAEAHPHDIGTMLDADGIAIRTGHHCCMPLMTRLGVPATARASFAFYNSFEDADRLADGVRRVVRFFS